MRIWSFLKFNITALNFPKFQSLSWWNENLKMRRFIVYLLVFGVSILVLVEWEFEASEDGIEFAYKAEFQSLSWWNENLKTWVLTLRLVTELKFQSLSWWNENLKGHELDGQIVRLIGFNPCLGGMRIWRFYCADDRHLVCLVSILVLVEWEFEVRRAKPRPRRSGSFNPCLGGMRIWRPPDGHFCVLRPVFQSLSWWNENLKRGIRFAGFLPHA